MHPAHVDVADRDRFIAELPMPGHQAPRRGDELEVREGLRTVDPEVVAQHRCSRNQIRPAASEELPMAARWCAVGRVAGAVEGERNRGNLLADQGGKSFDIGLCRVPSFEAFGGDGLVDSMLQCRRQFVSRSHWPSAE